MKTNPKLIRSLTELLALLTIVAMVIHEPTMAFAALLVLGRYLHGRAKRSG